ncbi:hypothetical protein RND81_13G187300 [Saponaria officinalis]|uniref:Uncharacterized protein n=1 Tax=Saponaria officinalis TaxID=3572 RepID=A0AAW1H266_SAPOF
MNIRTLLLYTLFFFQPKPGSSDPDDQLCLTGLHSAFQNPTLQNWTQSHFSNPCNGFESNMAGLTCNNGRVYRLSLPNSGLRGTLSPSLSKCTNLQALDLSSNSISGEIPAEIKTLTNLAVLNLSNNRLSSQIPPELYLCAYLNVIDLHNNLLVGPIPPQLGLLARLSTFNVANNRLSGMIPTSLAYRGGNMVKFNESDFEGNKGLFGYPLEAYKGDRGLSVMAIVGIGVGSGLLSLVISFTIVCVWLKVSEQKMAAAQEAKVGSFMPDY